MRKRKQFKDLDDAKHHIYKELIGTYKYIDEGMVNLNFKIPHIETAREMYFFNWGAICAYRSLLNHMEDKHNEN